MGWPFALALALGAGWLAYWRPWRDDVQVEVDGGALRIGEVTVRPAGTLRSGNATVLGDGRVRVDLRACLRPRLVLEVHDVAVARELLAALGLDRRRGTSQFQVRRLRGYAHALLLGCLFFAVPLSLVAAGINGWLGLFVLFGVLFTPLVEAVLARRQLTVGTDGIGIASPLRRTVLAHSRLRRVARVWPEGDGGEVVSRGFEIETDDGQLLRFDTRPERFAVGAWKTDPVFGAVFEAWTAWKSTTVDAPVHASTLLARGERSTREWIAALRGLASDGARGYRVAALDERALFAVLADAEAPRELRAAAAIALGANEQHVPKLRIAADVLADPLVRRVAVSSAEHTEDTQLEADLDEAFTPAPRRAQGGRPP